MMKGKDFAERDEVIKKEEWENLNNINISQILKR